MAPLVEERKTQQQLPAADLAGVQQAVFSTAGSGTQQPPADGPPNTGMLSSV
jgi:hypothetical protein